MQLAANTTVSWYSGGALATVLFEEGNEEQKDLARLWLDKQWSGSMTSPSRTGSDVGSASTRAIDMGDGTWHIEGVKRFITGGEHDASENIIHLVLARPEGAVPGTKGLSFRGAEVLDQRGRIAGSPQRRGRHQHREEDGSQRVDDL